MKNTHHSAGKDQKSVFPVLPAPWLITVLATVLLMIGAVNLYTFGVFFKPIANDFGWSRAAVSGSIAIRGLVTAAFVIPIGYWADRYGPRRITLLCLTVLGVSLLLIAKVTALWHLYVVQGLFIGIGVSGPFVVLTGTVGKWHDRKRGLALGIAAAGYGLSSVIFAPVAASMINAFGWRFATFMLGLVVLIVGIPGSLFLRNPPVASNVILNGGDIVQSRLFVVWREVPRFLKDRTFLKVTLMFLLFVASYQMVLYHFVNYATDEGVNVVTAASMMSALGVGSITGRLVMGAVSDRIGIRAAVAVCFTLLTISLILMNWNVSLWMLWVSVLIFGFSYGGEVPMVPAIIAERFGTERLVTIMGIAMSFIFIGSAVGPYMGGLIFDLYDSYFWALVLGAVFTTVSLALVLRLAPRA